MSWCYRTFIRPALFAQDSEEVHNRALTLLGRISRQRILCDALASFYAAPELPVDLFGLRFPNPVGLAAGMDKHAAATPAWAALGFGFCELGGVTWHSQEGNPLPRLFRAVADEALVNRMGFNNPGAEAMAQTLAEGRALGCWPDHPVGINLGKSKITPLEQAADDYALSFRLLRPYADFFVVNVSSPNTPQLRQLQDQAALDEILTALQEVNAGPGREPGVESRDGNPQPSTLPPAKASERRAGNPQPTPRPILVKIAPDLSFEALDEILELVGPRHVAGIVATNTTLTRPETEDEDSKRVYAETGGLSGRPLRARSTEIIRHLYRRSNGSVPIIGVGGVFNAEDAWEKICAGASLIQIYTGLIYEGPNVVKEIVGGLRERLAERGLKQLSEAVGIAA